MKSVFALNIFCICLASIQAFSPRYRPNIERNVFKNSTKLDVSILYSGYFSSDYTFDERIYLEFKFCNNKTKVTENIMTTDDGEWLYERVYKGTLTRMEIPLDEINSVGSRDEGDLSPCLISNNCYQMKVVKYAGNEFSEMVCAQDTFRTSRPTLAGKNETKKLFLTWTKPSKTAIQFTIYDHFGYYDHYKKSVKSFKYTSKIEHGLSNINTLDNCYGLCFMMYDCVAYTFGVDNVCTLYSGSNESKKTFKCNEKLFCGEFKVNTNGIEIEWSEFDETQLLCFRIQQIERDIPPSSYSNIVCFHLSNVFDESYSDSSDVPDESTIDNFDYITSDENTELAEVFNSTHGHRLELETQDADYTEEKQEAKSTLKYDVTNLIESSSALQSPNSTEVIEKTEDHDVTTETSFEKTTSQDQTTSIKLTSTVIVVTQTKPAEGRTDSTILQTISEPTESIDGGTNEDKDMMTTPVDIKKNLAYLKTESSVSGFKQLRPSKCLIYIFLSIFTRMLFMLF